MLLDIQYDFFSNHELFSHLNDDEINELCSTSEFNKAKKSDIIYFHNQRLDKVYIINQGRIKISICRDSELEIITEILMEGDIFGALSLTTSENTTCEKAQVLSNEVLFSSFNLPDFRSMMEKKPDFAIKYAKVITNKLNIVSKKYCDLVFDTVKARVLNFIKLHAKYEGKWIGKRVEINMFCNHNDIAKFTASSRQTVATILNELVREKKIICTGRKKLTIPDVTKLGI
ncbi:MAG: Crp/Fnr family transcriptional regulator [Bacteroidota bacterium]|nr:Crp/Fnr family transcriptional regulator [Bacteroidota bacterium]